MSSVLHGAEPSSSIKVSAVANRSISIAKLNNCEIARLHAQLSTEQNHWLVCRRSRSKQLVASRPASAPVLPYSQATHVFRDCRKEWRNSKTHDTKQKKRKKRKHQLPLSRLRLKHTREAILLFHLLKMLKKRRALAQPIQYLSNKISMHTCRSYWLNVQREKGTTADVFFLHS